VRPSSALRESGHDVVAVAEVLPRADDVAILAWAAAERRLLVTNDKDFGAIALKEGRTHAGILLLRLHDNRPANRARVARAVVDRWADRLEGALTVATERGVRIRPGAR
jgi:predicted nuclease of predicted toxin-antitoxin system